MGYARPWVLLDDTTKLELSPLLSVYMSITYTSVALINPITFILYTLNFLIVFDGFYLHVDFFYTRHIFNCNWRKAHYAISGTLNYLAYVSVFGSASFQITPIILWHRSLSSRSMAFTLPLENFQWNPRHDATMTLLRQRVINTKYSVRKTL